MLRYASYIAVQVILGCMHKVGACILFAMHDACYMHTVCSMHTACSCTPHAYARC